MVAQVLGPGIVDPGERPVTEQAKRLPVLVAGESPFAGPLQGLGLGQGGLEILVIGRHVKAPVDQAFQAEVAGHGHQVPGQAELLLDRDQEVRQPAGRVPALRPEIPVEVLDRHGPARFPGLKRQVDQQGLLLGFESGFQVLPVVDDNGPAEEFNSVRRHVAVKNREPQDRLRQTGLASPF